MIHRPKHKEVGCDVSFNFLAPHDRFPKIDEQLAIGAPQNSLLPIKFTFQALVTINPLLHQGCQSSCSALQDAWCWISAAAILWPASAGSHSAKHEATAFRSIVKISFRAGFRTSSHPSSYRTKSRRPCLSYAITSVSFWIKMLLGTESCAK